MQRIATSSRQSRLQDWPARHSWRWTFSRLHNALQNQVVHAQEHASPEERATMPNRITQEAGVPSRRAVAGDHPRGALSKVHLNGQMNRKINRQRTGTFVNGKALLRTCLTLLTTRCEVNMRTKLPGVCASEKPRSSTSALHSVSLLRVKEQTKVSYGYVRGFSIDS